MMSLLSAGGFGLRRPLKGPSNPNYSKVLYHENFILLLYQGHYLSFSCALPTNCLTLLLLVIFYKLSEAWMIFPFCFGSVCSQFITIFLPLHELPPKIAPFTGPLFQKKSIKCLSLSQGFNLLINNLFNRMT